MARKKHIPQRMCIACRKSQAKKTLIRLVRTPQGIVVNPTGRLPGRGAYLHADPDCWEIGLKSALARSLNCEIDDEDRQRIRQELETLLNQIRTKESVQRG